MEKNYKNNKTLPPLSKKTILPSIVIPNDENTKNNFSISKSPKKKNNNNNNNTISTQNYIDELKKGTYNILVVVRCRPLSQYESQISNFETIRILDEKMLVLIDPIEYNGPNNIFKNRSREQHYAFDFVFDKFSTQNEIFNNSVKFLIDGVVNGYNATVFAYGATGAGKTYTMTGNDNNPGIMPLTLNELFNKIEEYSNEREYKVKISYLEIYNENIRDLLRFTNNNTNYINSVNVNSTLNEELLDLREDPIKGIIITNITELLVNNSKDILSILKRGNRNRTQEATGANETSSRSHAILQISIEFKELHSGISIEIKNSKLSLIDLAGSERASQTQNRGIRLIEGANINRSLLTLGNCINALCETNLKGVKKYIPYRDSKLTRLLKDSLGGNSRTVMIANVSPAINTFDDTYNTLKYANRAKNIKTVVQRNVVNAQYHISNYVNIINSLKKEIFDLKMKMNNNNNNLVVNSNISNNNNINLNGNELTNNILIYEKTLKEIKDLCEKNIKLKEKIIKDKIEINSINNINNNNNFSNIISDNSMILNKTEINSTDTESNTKNTQINKINNNLNSNEQKLKENNLLLEKTILNCINNNKNKLNENQIDHLKLLIKINQQKLEKLENEFNDNLLQGKNEIKDEYIEQLEKQIMYRDELFIEKNINIFNNNNDNKNNNKNNKIKTFDEIKNEYDKKLPFINMFNGRKNILMGSKSMNIIPINKYNNYSNNYYNNNNNPYGNYYNYCNNYNNFNNFYNKLNQNSSFSQINNKYFNFFIPKFKKININNKKKLQYSNSTKNIIRNYSQSFKNNNNNNNNSVLITTPNKNLNQNNFNNNNSNYKHNRHNSNNNNNKNFIYGYYNFSKKNITTLFSNKERKNFPKSKIFNNRNKNNNSSRENSLIENSFSNINNNININNNNFITLNKKNNKSSGNLLTNEQIPQFKKSDLNFILNEKNRKRQKFLDKINGVYDKENL